MPQPSEVQWIEESVGLIERAKINCTGIGKVACALQFVDLYRGARELSALELQALDLRPSTWQVVPDPKAVCLDGSSYGYFFCPASSATAPWVAFLHGGGSCSTPLACLERSRTTLGSSKLWPKHPAVCPPAALDVNIVWMGYCDGGVWAGNREDPIIVRGKHLFARGTNNFFATIDDLIAKHGLADAKEVVVTGTSAGGLGTFLQLDHLSKKLPGIRLEGAPVSGFFLDHPGDGFKPPHNFTLNDLHNMTPTFLPRCLEQFSSEDQWRCYSPQHFARFITPPWFALNSRYDLWQLRNTVPIPCLLSRGHKCNKTEDDEIQKYGRDFLAALEPNLQGEGAANGAFISACIAHSLSPSRIEGRTPWEAFNTWRQRRGQREWVERCSSDPTHPGEGPCDTAPLCIPFHADSPGHPVDLDLQPLDGNRQALGSNLDGDRQALESNWFADPTML